MIADEGPGIVNDAVQRVFERLRREYLSEMPARLATLEEAVRTGNAESLRIGLHQLAGSGGSHGFPGISVAARELQGSLAGGASAAEIEAGLARLRTAVDVARAELGQG